jgi:hypothetical protein
MRREVASALNADTPSRRLQASVLSKKLKWQRLLRRGILARRLFCAAAREALK